MIERTLVLIKPSGFNYKERIMEKLGTIGDVIYSQRYASVPMDKLRRHYEEHEGVELYNWLLSFFEGKPIEVLVLEGEDAIKKTKTLVGHSDPRQANPWTIRAMAEDSLKLANLERRPIKNLVHCPTNLESARRELAIWT